MMRKTLAALLVAGTVLIGSVPALADEPPLGPWNSPQVAVAEVVCNGEALTVAVMLPRPAEGSAKFGRPGIAHISGSTSKQVAQGIRAELYFEGELVFVDEYHWGQGKETPIQCTFEVPLGEGMVVRVTVFVFETPQGP
jgi:hypothetical protein